MILFVVEAEANEAIFIFQISAPLTVLPLFLAREGAGTYAEGLNLGGVEGAKLIAAGIVKLDAEGILALDQMLFEVAMVFEHQRFGVLTVDKDLCGGITTVENQLGGGAAGVVHLGLHIQLTRKEGIAFRDNV